YPRRPGYLRGDSFDLPPTAAVRYARSLNPTPLGRGPFAIETGQAAQRRGGGGRGGGETAFAFVDPPAPPLPRPPAQRGSREAAVPGTQVTAVLPRRTYSPLLGRLLHDRTADKIAAAVSQIPNAAATIVPFDVRSRLEVLHERQLERERAAAGRVPGDGQAGPGAASGTVPAAGAAAAPPRRAARPGPGGRRPAPT